MKRLASLFLALTSVVAATSQDKSLFIYSNDGRFDAFHHEQIDSITYSKFDLDSVEYTRFVTQEIWSGGVAKRMPIETIDSIGFVQHPTIVSNDVFPFTAAHDPYFVSTADLQFTMTAETPADMRPVKGNVVVAQPDCLAFESGILARVKTVTLTDAGYEYTCEAASLDDVYDQIMFFGEADVDTDEPLAANGMRRIQKDFDKEIWNKTFEGSIPHIPGSQYHINDKASCSIKICKTLTTPLYLEIGVTNELTSNASIDIEKAKDLTPDPVQIGKTLKVGRITFPHPLLSFIWLEPQIRLFGWFKGHGELDLDIAAHFNRTDNVKLIYSDRAWSISHTPQMDAAVDAARLSMKGSAEVGLTPEIMFALNGSATGIGITGDIGVKQTLDFTFDVVQCYDTSVYEALKDTHTDTYLTYSTSIFVQAGLFDNNSKRKDYNVLNREKLLLSKYIFPLFKQPTYRYDASGSHFVSVDTERDVLLPINLGMRLYDEDNNFVQESADLYKYDKKVNRYSHTFTGLDLTKTYKAYPVIRLGDFALQATPAITVNRCPAQVDSVNYVYAYYDSSLSMYNYRMLYTIHASLENTEGVTEWGVEFNNTKFPFSEVAPTGAKTLDVGASKYGLDWTNFVYEVTRDYRAYVKRIDSAGNEVITYSDPLNATIKYDTKPRLNYANAKIDGITVATTTTDQYGNTMRMYKSVASFDMTLEGVLWLDYINGGVDNPDYELVNNPEWRPTYENTWHSQWETNAWDRKSDISHSNWHNLHLRNGAIVESDHLNWHGRNGQASSVDITPSPSYPVAEAASATASDAITVSVPNASAAITRANELIYRKAQQLRATLDATSVDL